MTKRHRRAIASLAVAIAATAAAGTAVLAGGGGGGMNPPPGPPFEIGRDGTVPSHVQGIPIDPASGRRGTVGRECLAPRPPRPGEKDPCSMRLLPPGTSAELGEE